MKPVGFPSSRRDESNGTNLVSKGDRTREKRAWEGLGLFQAFPATWAVSGEAETADGFLAVQGMFRVVWLKLAARGGGRKLSGSERESEEESARGKGV